MMPRVLNQQLTPQLAARLIAAGRAVYVGRPSVWGNPFRTSLTATRDDVIKQFERWLIRSPTRVAQAKSELRGKDLVCWCKPLACHADVLLRVANS